MWHEIYVRLGVCVYMPTDSHSQLTPPQKKFFFLDLHTFSPESYVQIPGGKCEVMLWVPFEFAPVCPQVTT